MITKNYILKHKTANALPLLAIVVFVYIILFEFILPANGFLPRPSILIESVTSLFKHYNFLYVYAFTLSILYASLLVGYYLIRIFRKIIQYFAETFPEIVNLLIVNKIFITISLVFIFHFWFGNSIYGEIFIALIVVIGNLKVQYFNDFYKVKKEYMDAGRSLTISDDKKNSIIWKSIQSGLFASLNLSHYSLWSLLLIYEFINGTDGIGSVLRLAIKYNDFSIVVLLIIIITITLWLSSLLLKAIKEKFFFWEA